MQRETETQTLAAQSFARGWNACNRHWMSELSQLPSKVVAEIKVDTDEIMERIKQEWYKPNEWIPCSERLPDMYRRHYLVSLADKKEVDIAYFTKYGTWETFRNGDEVEAWMPLPESYKEEQE